MNGSTRTPEIRATVDTNVIVSGLITRDGPPARLVDAIIDRRLALITSIPLAAEVRAVLERPYLTQRYDIDPRLKELLLDRMETADYVVPSALLPVRSRDPKDDKLLECALAAEVPFLVTGDADLLALDGELRMLGLRVVRVREFLMLTGMAPDA